MSLNGLREADLRSSKGFIEYCKAVRNDYIPLFQNLFQVDVSSIPILSSLETINQFEISKEDIKYWNPVTPFEKEGVCIVEPELYGAGKFSDYGHKPLSLDQMRDFNTAKVTIEFETLASLAILSLPRVMVPLTELKEGIVERLQEDEKYAYDVNTLATTLKNAYGVYVGTKLFQLYYENDGFLNLAIQQSFLMPVWKAFERTTKHYFGEFDEPYVAGGHSAVIEYVREKKTDIFNGEWLAKDENKD